MEIGGAAYCIRVFSATAIIELGSIGRIIGSQLIIPKASIMQKELVSTQQTLSPKKQGHRT